MMIKIYCLINPLTGIPFYVGATKTKLNARLAIHMTDAKNSPHKNTLSYKRQILFNEFYKYGLLPEIKLLMEVQQEFSSQTEKFFYYFFRSQGIELMQLSSHFDYEKRYLLSPYQK